MKIDEARRILANANGEEDAVDLPPSVLPRLNIDDMADGASLRIGVLKDGMVHLDWTGSLRREGQTLVGEADHTWTRKYWYSPLGLEQYLDLVRRAVETRHRVKGDVAFTDYDDDGAYISLRFTIATTETNLARAYERVRKIEAEVLEAAEQAADEVGRRTAEIGAAFGMGVATPGPPCQRGRQRKHGGRQGESA